MIIIYQCGAVGCGQVDQCVLDSFERRGRTKLCTLYSFERRGRTKLCTLYILE